MKREVPLSKGKWNVQTKLKEAVKEAGAAGLFNNVQHQKKRAYLLALSSCGNVTLAAKAAGVDRSMVYKWRNGVASRPNDHGDEAFAAAEKIAREMAAVRNSQQNSQHERSSAGSAAAE